MGKAKECAFCERLRLHAENIGAGFVDNNGAAVHFEYRAALLIDAYTDREHRFRGRDTAGEYRLNFCPECGAKIKRRLRKWREAAKERENPTHMGK